MNYLIDYRAVLKRMEERARKKFEIFPEARKPFLIEGSFFCEIPKGSFYLESIPIKEYQVQ